MEKSKDTIGVIGYRGAVGQVIVSLLEEKYNVIKGGRNRDIREENICYANAYDEQSLEEFSRKCTVVINAAGPSYVIGDRIAKTACALGVKYVDVFGGNLLQQKISAYEKNGRFIICAGSVPGLSGILSKYLIKKCPDDQQKIEVYQGGRESGGIGGLSDIILSMLNGYGHSGKQIINDEIVRCAADISEKVSIPGLPESVYVNPYLTAELISAAKGHNNLSIASYQIFPDKESMELLTAGSIRYFSSNSETEKSKILSEVSLKQAHLITRKAKWFVLLLQSESESKKYRIYIKTSNSTALTALIAVMSAEQLAAEEGRQGLNWAYELLEPENVIERIKLITPAVEITCTQEQKEHAEMMEGVV